MNLRGIVYDALNDRLIVSDVNNIVLVSDGRIFVVESASTQDGVANPSVHLEGAATFLGNPVDLAYDGVSLFVAENSNNGGRLLIYQNLAAVTTSFSTDVAPDLSIDLAAVESIVLIPAGLAPTAGGSIEAD